MKAQMRTVFAALTSSGLALYGAAAMAAPATLTDGQLDGVTAGVALISSSDAGAVGAFTMGGTSSNVVAGASAVPGQPGLESGAGLADGTAVAVGTNFGLSGEPPASSATNVQTAGSAGGTMVINSTVNSTIHGAGGVTMQVGWTFVFGVYGTL